MEEPKYENYSQEEIADVMSNIDRDKYPERYHRAKTIFESRGGNAKQVESIEMRSPMTSWGFILFLLIVLNFVLDILLPVENFSFEYIRDIAIRLICFVFLVGYGVLAFPERENNEN